MASARDEAAESSKQAVELERAQQATISDAARQAAAVETAREVELAEATRRKELHAYARGRGVTAVGHFTRLTNLENILKHGLQPKARLDEMGVECTVNDGLRLDDVEGVCLSISFTNYKLFYKFRKEFPGEQWVVLVLPIEVIQKKACVFNPRNAASNEMTMYPKERRMQMDALQAMFYDHEIEVEEAQGGGRRMLRERLGLPDHFTTDPQAEIVVTESIGPALISEVIFNCDDTTQNRGILLRFFQNVGWDGTVYLRGEDAFVPRHDYKYWRNSNG